MYVNTSLNTFDNQVCKSCLGDLLYLVLLFLKRSISATKLIRRVAKTVL